MKTPRHSVITSVLSRTKDRFHEYNEPKTLEERLSMVAEMDGIDGFTDSTIERVMKIAED